MDHYQGLTNDAIKGGGRHIQEMGWGGEVFNFKNNNGQVYGYVQPKISANKGAFTSTIKIERIGAGKYDDSINNVTVVFTSTDPVKKGTRVIGWYKNATVCRNAIMIKNNSRKLKGLNMPYYAVAKPEDCVLLPKDSRIEIVPRGKNGMGQSNVWYCDKNDDFKKYILDIINNKKKIKSATKGEIKINIEKKQQVERNAVKFAAEYYSNLGYDIISVEKDNIGWDLEATNGREKLLIEVKGLSGDFKSVDFSANEYAKMNKSANKINYRIAVVAQALQKKPDFFLFSFSEEKNNWICQITNRSISINEKVSAKLILI